MLEMAQPGRRGGELSLRVRLQQLDHRPRQGMLAHVLQRRRVDDVVGMAGTQQLEEVQPALAARRAEPGEAVVADVRADPVGAAVARAGVVHRDPGGGLQPRPQHLPGLGEEVVLPADQQAHHLTLADADPNGL
jgi:hypothetical protein